MKISKKQNFKNKRRCTLKIIFAIFYFLSANIPDSRFEVFPAEVEDNERVPAFDNPKLFHILLLNFLHEIENNTKDDREETRKKHFKI